jgi:hypothetical protein
MIALGRTTDRCRSVSATEKSAPVGINCDLVPLDRIMILSVYRCTLHHVFVPSFVAMGCSFSTLLVPEMLPKSLFRTTIQAVYIQTH